MIVAVECRSAGRLNARMEMEIETGIGMGVELHFGLASLWPGRPTGLASKFKPSANKWQL